MRIRDEVIIGSVISLIALGIGVSGARTYSNNLRSAFPSPAAGQNENATGAYPFSGTPAGQGVSGGQLTREEVSRHNSPGDCWLIMENNVYDVTTYLAVHPGGARRITPYCGADATEAFATQDGRGSHSQVAQQQKAMLRIGALGETVSTQSIQNAQQSVTDQPIMQRGGEEEDDD